MRAHPIPPVTEPLQYRAIGLVRGTYAPTDPEQLTRGTLTDAQGVTLETVVLGRVLTLMRRHLPLDQPHLWVVYPRSRESDHLHLQIAGVWEPSTLAPDQADASDKLRFEAINQPELYENDSELQITVDFDKAARTITITDKINLFISLILTLLNCFNCKGEPFTPF